MRACRSFTPFILTPLVLSLQASLVQADVRLPRILSDHMVLQRDRPIPIWGWATAGEEVAVTLSENNSAKTSADEHGAWRVNLAAMPAGGPYKLTVSGKNTVTLQDILIGEVWLCIGQSNMQFALSASQHAGRDVPKAADPHLRLTGALMVASRPRSDVNLNMPWTESNPGSAGKFSAVAYYFGKELREKLDVPVGLISSCAGAIPIESFTPLTGMKAVRSQSKIVKISEQMAADYQHLRESALASWLKQAREAIALDTPLPPLPAVDETIVQRGWSPTGLYNGGIHPLIPLGIRGVVYYQGEANNGQGMQYLDKMQALIQGWRKAWGQGDFPFIIVQIAPWSGYPEGNVEGIWDAQRAALAIPNTGLAVTTDLVPNLQDIHPNQKLEVGHRLALWALAKTYGQADLTYSGPLFKSAKIEGAAIRVQFDHAASGLTTRDGKAPDWFQVGSAAGFVDAEAAIDGDCVIVRNNKVPQPLHVRLGWKNTAQPNLVNKAGLPACPFRTDCGPVKFTSGSHFAVRKQVELSSEVPGVIRYTLDGSTPSEQSAAYLSPLDLRTTSSLSARLFTEDGRGSLTATKTYTQAAAVAYDGKVLTPGLDYEFYAGRWVQMPSLEKREIDASGTLDGLLPVTFPESFMAAHRFHGYLDIAAAGEYTFTLKCHGGAKMMLDGKLAVDHEGFHAPTEKPGEPVPLKPGKHSFAILYHEGGGVPNISLMYEGPGIAKQPVPDAAYYREEPQR